MIVHLKTPKLFSFFNLIWITYKKRNKIITLRFIYNNFKFNPKKKKNRKPEKKRINKKNSKKKK